VAFFPSFVTVIIMLIFAGGFGLTRIEYANSFMNKHIPSDRRATILSSISMFVRFSLMIFNPIVGLLASKSLALALIFVGALSLLVFFFSPIESEFLEK